MNDELEQLDQYDFVDDDALPEVTSKYSELLGTFLIAFSSLEHELNIAISEIISDRTHTTGYLIIERMSVKDKLDLFYKLYSSLESVKSKKHIKNLNLIQQSFISINTFRNRIAHANWQSVDTRGYVRVKILVDNEEGDVGFKKVKITPKIIKDKVKEVKKLKKVISSYMETVFYF